MLTLFATELKENANLKYPYQLQQTSAGEIQLSFEQVPFNAFMTWLADIDSTYRITVKQFEVSATETAGLTKLMIIVNGS